MGFFAAVGRAFARAGQAIGRALRGPGGAGGKAARSARDLAGRNAKPTKPRATTREMVSRSFKGPEGAGGEVARSLKSILADRRTTRLNEVGHAKVRGGTFTRSGARDIYGVGEKVFYRATQNLWNRPGVSVKDRDAAIIEGLGVRNLNEAYKLVMKEFGDVVDRVVEAMESNDAELLAQLFDNDGRYTWLDTVAPLTVEGRARGL